MGSQDQLESLTSLAKLAISVCFVLSPYSDSQRYRFDDISSALCEWAQRGDSFNKVFIGKARGRSGG